MLLNSWLSSSRIHFSLLNEIADKWFSSANMFGIALQGPLQVRGLHVTSFTGNPAAHKRGLAQSPKGHFTSTSQTVGMDKAQ